MKTLGRTQFEQKGILTNPTLRNRPGFKGIYYIYGCKTNGVLLLVLKISTQYLIVPNIFLTTLNIFFYIFCFVLFLFHSSNSTIKNKKSKAIATFPSEPDHQVVVSDIENKSSRAWKTMQAHKSCIFHRHPRRRLAKLACEAITSNKGRSRRCGLLLTVLRCSRRARRASTWQCARTDFRIGSTNQQESLNLLCPHSHACLSRKLILSPARAVFNSYFPSSMHFSNKADSLLIRCQYWSYYSTPCECAWIFAPLCRGRTISFPFSLFRICMYVYSDN